MIKAVLVIDTETIDESLHMLIETAVKARSTG